MSPALRVITPGLLSTVQDLGRPGYQRLGIPVSGALDPLSLRAANALVGNPPDAGALEVMYLGPTLAVEAEDARLSFVGADALIEIMPGIDARSATRVTTMRSIRVKRGELVRIGSLSGGSVLYVAVEGGFDIERVLGSMSTFLRGGFGGWQGRALVAGDRLPICRNCASDRGEARMEGLDLLPPARVRAIAGPQSDYFSEREIAMFFDSEYTVSPGSDRMGMRLAGRQIEHARGFNIASDAIAPGSIQVPGNGQPIVLLADRQTTGGYPKIATVISADLPAVGRIPIGAKIVFERVTIEHAQTLRRSLLAETAAMQRARCSHARDRFRIRAAIPAKRVRPPQPSSRSRMFPTSASKYNGRTRVNPGSAACGREGKAGSDRAARAAPGDARGGADGFRIWSRSGQLRRADPGGRQCRHRSDGRDASRRPLGCHGRSGRSRRHLSESRLHAEEDPGGGRPRFARDRACAQSTESP